MKRSRSTHLATLFWALATLLVHSAVADPTGPDGAPMHHNVDGAQSLLEQNLKRLEAGTPAVVANFRPFSPLYVPPGFVPKQNRHEFSQLMHVLPGLLRKSGLSKTLIQKRVDALALSLAIISTESEFKRTAQSGKRAKGFWQLMLTTAREMHAKHRKEFPQNLKKITDKNIYYLRVNNLAGAFYFRHLLEHPWNKEGSVEWAVMAYNAGATNVRDGVIPEETRKYLQHVMSNYSQIIAYNRDLRPARSPRAITAEID